VNTAVADNQIQREVESCARDLVIAANKLGLVVTISQRPFPPLAMGNYESVVEVRPVVVRG
jgi:hypothetical protein